MAQKMVSNTMREHADLLLLRSLTWTRAVRKRDGRAFVIFPSSRQDDAELPAGYYTNERGCTCRGFYFRGICAHVVAVRDEAEAAREAAARKPLDRYNELMDNQLVDAF